MKSWKTILTRHLYVAVVAAVTVASLSLATAALAVSV